MEVTADVVEEGDAPLSLDDLACRFEPMFERLERAVRESKAIRAGSAPDRYRDRAGDDRASDLSS
jgi:hypothetical protein